ncbi:hypothetical protein PRIC2_014769 [Phytophthora ramorum]
MQGQLRVAVVGSQTCHADSPQAYTVYRTSVNLRGLCYHRLIRYRHFLAFAKRLKLAPDAPRISVKLPPKLWWSRKASLQPETVEQRQVLLNEFMQQVCTRQLTLRSEERLLKLLQVGDYAPEDEEDRVINSRLSIKQRSATPTEATFEIAHTPGSSRSRMPSRTSTFRNTRSSRAVALPRLDVIQRTSWVNDEDRFSCHICNKRFSVFKRKHHCRACGEVICNSCSLYHRIQSRSMRVCVSCVAFHSLDSPTSAGSTGFLRPGGGSAHSSNSSRKTSNGSAADRNRSSTLSSGVWLNPWPEPPYPVDEDERLGVLRELNIRELGLSGKFNMYCEVVAKTMKCPIAYVSIIEDEEQILVANIGMARTTLPRELSFCAHTICQPSVLVVLDTKNDERFRESPMVKGDKGAVKIRYYAGATIFSRDGHALGTVAVLDTKPRREADQEHIGMLQHLSFLASEKMTQSTIHEDSDSEFL